MVQRIFKQYGRSAFCCGVGEILGGVSSVMTPIFGGVADAQNVSDANAARIQMQRETNDLNYKMFHEAQDFQNQMWNKQASFDTEIWNKTNAYNSPEQVAERLRGIGVNPLKVLAGEGASMQTASLINSPSAGSPSPVPAQSPSIESYQGNSAASQGINRAIDSYFSNMNQAEDLKAKKLELLYNSMTLETRIERQQSELREQLNKEGLPEYEKKRIQSELDKNAEDLSVLRSVRGDRIKAYSLQNEYTNATTNLQNAQERYYKSLERITNLNADWLPKEKEQALKESESRIATSYMVARAQGLSAEAAMQSAKAALENALKTDGVKMNDDQRNEYIQKKLKVMESEYERNNRQSKTWFRQVLDGTQDFDNAMNNTGNRFKTLPYGATPAKRGDNPRTVRW